ncbi:MAG: two-component system chemotaxis response regulator CheB [bacterium]|jgi:two-component system chemotaxis response regulator CheB
MDNKIKVLVVDDSALMRSELKKIIQHDPSFIVVATARNGTEVLDKVKKFSPDVVTLDINMPKMDGLEALKILMQEAPLPVLMVSSLTEEGADETIEALSLGAFDFIHKPSGGITLDLARQGELIREKLRTASLNARRFQRINQKRVSTRVVRTAVRETVQTPVRRTVQTPVRRTTSVKSHIVGIGVSTGGPKTLMSILPKIPENFPGTILIAQHMPEKFTYSFANRLNSICPLGVKEAEDGEILQSGMIYIAPGGKHMQIKNRNNRVNIVEIVEHIPNILYKPSVDILFESLLKEVGDNWTGVILTGMGNDGAKGLLALRKRGGHTIAEAEESCVVFGMPAKAIEIGAAEFILPVENIADKIVNLTGNAK